MKPGKTSLRKTLKAIGLLLAACCVARLASAAPQQKDWEISITSSLPSGVALVGEAAEAQITVQNPTPQKHSVELWVEIAAPGEKARREQWSLAFDGEGQQSKALTLPTNTRGYWSILATLSEGGNVLAKKESGLAVVEKPRNYGQLDPGSFFGSMFNRDPEAGQRIGIKYERQMTVWEWLSTAEGSYKWEHLDARVDLLSRHGVGVVLEIRTEKPPKWAAWKSIEELAKPEFVPYFAQFTKDVVERYRGRIAAIEIINEPDLECARGNRGEMPPHRVYAALLKAACEASKSVAPELPVLGLDVSGVDFPQLRFAGQVLAQAMVSLDIISGHPYASTRYLGGGAKADSPDAIDTQGRMTAMAELMKKHGLKPRVWPTEFGWGLGKDEPMTSPATELWAAYAGQAIATARSVPEVEKLFWFSMSFPGSEGGYTYGMFRGTADRSYPTPAAAVYATCARYLDQVSFVRRFALGEFGKGLRFVDKRSGDGVFVLWLSEPKRVGGEVRIPAPGKNFESIEMNDGYGRAVKGDWAIHAMPLFIKVSGEDSDRLESYIRSAQLRARETLLVEQVYLSDASHVNVSVANNSGAKTSIKLFPQARPELARSSQLPPGTSVVSLALPTPLSGKGSLPLEFLEEADGKRTPLPFSYDLTAVSKLTQVQIDGRLNEVAGLVSSVRDTRDAVYPRDPGVDWNGSKDLSMEVWTGWTDEGLYLAVKVTDDIATEANEDGALFWQKDSLQIAWDTGNQAETGYNEKCLEIGVFRTASGTGVYRTYPEPKLLTRNEVLVGSQRDQAATTYEIMVPWKTLNIPAAASGRVFRMNLIANDNDGHGRKCWIGLTPGIGEGKHPAAFRQWVLDNTQEPRQPQKTSPAPR